VCLDCERRYELAWVREQFEAKGERAPDCKSCGGHIKTATVSFGQAMPAEAMRRAEDFAESSDLFVSIGSSLVVWPAAGVPLRAKKSGARLVIVNREETELDEFADLVIRSDIGEVFSPFITE
jgi:NAD-dependent deacetylase